MTFGAIQAGNISSFVPDISLAKGAGSDIIKLLDSMPEVDAESTEGKIPDEKTIRGRICFEGVHFRYQLALVFVSCVIFPLRLNLAHISHWSEPVGYHVKIRFVSRIVHNMLNVDDVHS
jgi:ABC-type multidrug transport system fused ATPase/permease subunit